MNQYFKFYITCCFALVVANCSTPEKIQKAAAVDSIIEEKSNVLFIAVDDLNDWVGVLEGHPQVQTPNIDKFCDRGSVVFSNAVCAAPVCGPSRSALLSGFMPHNTGIYDNGTNMRLSKLVQENATLPEYFSKNGYRTLSRGKIFHKHFTEKGVDEGQWAFDSYVPKGKPTSVQKEHLFSQLNNMIDGKVVGEKAKRGAAGHISWGPTQEPYEETMDYRTADWAKRQLESEFDQPFFMAVGFTRPHLPWFAPQEFFNKYDLETLEVPQVLEDDLEDITNKKGDPIFKASEEYKWIKKNGLEKEVTRAYLANITYVDACLGVVFDALENSPYAKNTIVVLWGDHGYHIGEKQRFKKNTLWSEAVTMPFVVRMPGTTTKSYCTRTVSLIDIYPTLVKVCGLPEKELDGNDFSALLKNPKSPWNYPGVTVAKHGTSILTEEYHYIEHTRGAMELYDIINDPMEWHNLADDTKYEAIKTVLQKSLPQNRAEPLKVKGDRSRNKKIKKLNTSIKASRNLALLK